VHLAFQIPELSALAQDYVAILADEYPAEWRRLNDLAVQLFGEPTACGIAESEAAIQFVAGPKWLEMWIEHRLKHSSKLEPILVEAMAAAMRLRRWFLELGRTGRIQISGTLSDGSEYSGDSLLFDLETDLPSGKIGMALDLERDEIRVPQTDGALLVIGNVRLTLRRAPFITDENLSVIYDAHIIGADEPTRDEDLAWARRHGIRRDQVRKARRDHPNPALHQPGKPSTTKGKTA
jgi:hypothetical protein